MQMSGKLTHHQRTMLKVLADMHDAHPANTYGFNPTWNERAARAWRTSLAEKGLVNLNRISDFHIRYSITPAGLAALKEPSDAE
jgi:hypothetical protein